MFFVVGLANFAGLVGALQVVLPSAVNVFEMEMLNLTCNATGYTEGMNLMFSWRRLLIWNNVSLPGASLVLAPVTIDDAGEYECQVTTDSNEKATESVKIVVQYLPRRTLFSLNKFAGELDHTVVLNCSVSAYPMCTFYWTNPQGINLTSAVDYAVDSTGNYSVLTIKAIKESDYGNYTCVAYNLAGISRFALSLMKPGKPDSPLQCNATDVDSRYAIIECIPGFSGGTAQLNYVVMRQSPGSSGGQKAKSSSSYVRDGRVAIHVEELSPGINYTLKISAENSYGQSDDSFEVLVWMLSDGGHSLPLAVIIGASVSGGAFIILISIIALICHLKCSKCCRSSTASTSQGKLSNDLVDEYHTDFQGARLSTNKPENFSVIKSQVKQTNSRASQSFIDLDHNPGESYIGYENLACVDPFSLNQPRCSGYGDQPALAGHGALRAMVEMTSFEKPRIVKPCGIPIPPFQPNVPLEYPREKLFLKNKLGNGSYGETWEAEAEGIFSQPGQRMVAVKMLRENHTPEEELYLYNDLQTMKLLHTHPNIILLLGCCSKTRPLCLMMELATHGSLLNLLRQQRHAFVPNNFDENISKVSHERHFNLTLQDLMKFALQVASGMDYISSNQLIHRDLAARNVLLDEQMVCKISDFGTAEDVIKIRQYESRTKRRLPLRWMAPESLTLSEYSVLTDVWSFGILLWEIVTLGSTPYPGHSGPQVLELVQKGIHMEQPVLCPNAMFTLMNCCWRLCPAERPLFSILKETLCVIVNQLSSNCIYVDQMSENTFEILHDQPGEKC